MLNPAAGPAAAIGAANPWLGVGALAVDAINGGAPGTAAGTSNSAFDSSAWNVNFGSGDIDSQMDKTTSPLGGLGQLDNYMPYAVLFVGVMVVWRLTRKR